MLPASIIYPLPKLIPPKESYLRPPRAGNANRWADPMQNTQTFYQEMKTPFDAPPQYKVRALEIARERAGRQLFDILWKSRLPAVVDIKEIIKQAPPGMTRDYYMGNYDETIRIEISVTPVEHRQVVMTSYYPESAQHRVHLTAFGVSTRALRAKFRAFIQPLLSKIGGK